MMMTESREWEDEDMVVRDATSSWASEEDLSDRVQEEAAGQGK